MCAHVALRWFISHVDLSNLTAVRLGPLLTPHRSASLSDPHEKAGLSEASCGYEPENVLG